MGGPSTLVSKMAAHCDPTRQLPRDVYLFPFRSLWFENCLAYLTYRRNPAINYDGLPDESGGVVSLAEVRIQEGESLENALRRFKRKVQQEDIIKEVKRHSYYLKPGEKKRAKEALARKRSRKKARKEQD